MSIAKLGFTTSGQTIGVLESKQLFWSGYGDIMSLIGFGFYDDIVNGFKIGTKTGNTYENIARQATKNSASNEVVIGKFNQGGISYINVANQRGASYFQIGNWDDVVKQVGESNIWKINECFIKQQVSAGKTFILSHSPIGATGYFAKEVKLLKDLGYEFLQEDSVWKAVIRR